MCAAKKGLAEVGILRRVHFIYERATRKFKADLSLWLDWIAFCKRTKSNKQFSKVPPWGRLFHAGRACAVALAGGLAAGPLRCCHSLTRRRW